MTGAERPGHSRNGTPQAFCKCACRVTRAIRESAVGAKSQRLIIAPQPQSQLPKFRSKWKAAVAGAATSSA
jgi:hypothetical protein